MIEVVRILLTIAFILLLVLIIKHLLEWLLSFIFRETKGKRDNQTNLTEYINSSSTTINKECRRK